MLTIIRGAGLALLVALPLLGQAQLPAAWPKTGQLVEEGIALHDKEDYPGAIAKYQAVTPGDTTYALAQSELALTLHTAGKHEEAIAAARRALARNPFKPQTYNTLANAQEQLKQIDAALATYQQALKLFPYNQMLYYNRGVLQLSQHNPAEALASLQRSLELRPTHASTHRLLGVLAAQQGQPSHTLISWLTFLLLSPDNEASNTVLVQAENLALGVPLLEDKDKVKPVSANTAFAELDQLLESKVALQKGYVTKVKFDAALVKQVQLLIEKFPVDGPADDYWVKTYGPMVAVLRRDDNLTPFTYFILRTAGDSKAVQWIKANKGRAEKMLLAVLPPLVALREQQLPGAGLPGPRQRAWFNNEDKLAGLGPGNLANDKFTATGEWTGVSSDGAVAHTGRYTAAGLRTGQWNFVRPDGSLERSFSYNDQGELGGVGKVYFPNGQPSLEATYARNKLNGPASHFNECGTRLDTQTYRDDLQEGPYAVFFPNGQVRYRGVMSAGQSNGKEEGFYANGAPEFVATAVNGQRQGPSPSYFADKQLEKEVNFEKGVMHGAFKRYAANGAVRETGQFEHGKRVGPWQEYLVGPKPSKEKSYDEAGDLHGPYRQYDGSGHLYAVTEYSHGRVKSWKYFDQTGKLLLEGSAGKGRVTARLLDQEGNLAATGDYVDGYHVGEWKEYYRDGVVERIVHFDAKGKQIGATEAYYANGQLARREHLDDNGNQTGYHETYFADGGPKLTGYFREGQRYGTWKNYYPTGQLSEAYEYHRGQLNGFSQSYAPDGTLTQQRTYEFGQLRQWLSYDAKGQVLGQVDLARDSKSFTLRYPLGSYEASVGCYELAGPTAWLPPKGSATARFAHIDGRRDGDFQDFWPDGQLQTKGHYLGGQMVGEWLDYYPNGKLWSKRHYNTAGENGESSYFHPNGQLGFTQTYLNGTLHGVTRRYNPAGELLIEKRYEQGYPLAYRGPGPADAPWKPLPREGGVLTTTFANGKPAASETIKHGWLAGTMTYYYADGTLFRRVNYVKEMRSGLAESFYPNGKLMESQSYAHDILQGPSRYYRPDGTPECEVSYENDEVSGPMTYFDAAGKPLRTEVQGRKMLYGSK